MFVMKGRQKRGDCHDDRPHRGQSAGEIYVTGGSVVFVMKGRQNHLDINYGRRISWRSEFRTCVKVEVDVLGFPS